MKIEVLFPEVCCLYAELQNVEYLRRSAEGKIEVINTDLKSEPYFARHDDVAMIYMGTTTEAGQELAVKALTPYKDRIAELIRNGQLFLITGNAIEIFGEYILLEDGSKIPCLGLFPTYAERHMMHRYNSLWIGQFKDIDVVGYKSLFGLSFFIDEDKRTSVFAKPSGLFTAERGDGINKTTKEEGYRLNNFMATYLIGPLFILNPLLTKKALEFMGLPEARPLFEKESMESFELRCKEYRDPTIGFTYG